MTETAEANATPETGAQSKVDEAWSAVEQQFAARENKAEATEKPAEQPAEAAAEPDPMTDVEAQAASDAADAYDLDLSKDGDKTVLIDGQRHRLKDAVWRMRKMREESKKLESERAELAKQREQYEPAKKDADLLRQLTTRLQDDPAGYVADVVAKFMGGDVAQDVVRALNERGKWQPEQAAAKTQARRTAEAQRDAEQRKNDELARQVRESVALRLAREPTAEEWEYVTANAGRHYRSGSKEPIMDAIREFSRLRFASPKAASKTIPTERPASTPKAPKRMSLDEAWEAADRALSVGRQY